MLGLYLTGKVVKELTFTDEGAAYFGLEVWVYRSDVKESGKRMLWVIVPEYLLEQAGKSCKDGYRVAVRARWYEIISNQTGTSMTVLAEELGY